MVPWPLTTELSWFPGHLVCINYIALYSVIHFVVFIVKFAYEIKYSADHLCYLDVAINLFFETLIISFSNT